MTANIWPAGRQLAGLPDLTNVEHDLAQLVYDDQTRRLIYDGLRIGRRQLFTQSVRLEDVVQIEVEGSRDEVIHAFATAGYTPNWLLSYNYQGEDGNMVHFHYDPETYPGLPFRQDHVRLFVDDYPEGTIGLACHSEPNALVHRAAHLDERTYSAAAGAKRARAILAAAELDHHPATGGSSD